MPPTNTTNGPLPTRSQAMWVSSADFTNVVMHLSIPIDGTGFANEDQ
jgi:hypothetical protein